MIALNLLWHMHQPDYRLPGSSEALLPWVRLHAARGYSDLAASLKEHDNLRCTVNFSGILLEQLLAWDAAEPDLYARLSALPAQELGAEQRAFIVRNFFSANLATLIKPHARYLELYRLRESAGGLETDTAHEAFSDHDLTDLIVWFNLAWIGYSGRRLPAVQELIAMGSGYTLREQQEVLEIHDELVTGVLPLYRELAQLGLVELSFTPYAHPILPLLCDLQGMGTVKEHDPLPEFRFPGDAAEHARRGAELYKRAFGVEPAGAWPSEGSVSDAALAVLATSGMRWAATDQANLGVDTPLGQLSPWRWQQDGRSLLMFFRDLRLADNIGFQYATWQPLAAAAHFVNMVHSLGSQSDHPNPVVTVALDGENPWEYYPDGGEQFLTALSHQLAAKTDVQCASPSQLLELGGYPVMESIRPGSWIGGSFDIWTRHADTRLAWRRLARARQDLAAHATGTVLDHLLIAEGSDWFWWYGDDFVSSQKEQFDLLFRSQLMAAYAAAGQAVPDELRAPIGGGNGAGLPAQAPSAMTTVLDGRVTSYFEWQGAVTLSRGSGQSSMAAGTAGITALHYGFSKDTLMMRLDLEESLLAQWRVQGGTLRLCLFQGEIAECREFSLPSGQKTSAAGDIAIDSIAELSLPLNELSLDLTAIYLLNFELIIDRDSVRFPASGTFSIRFPQGGAGIGDWMV